MSTDGSTMRGPTGWVVPDATTLEQMQYGERKYFDKAVADNPIAYRMRAEKDWVSPELKDKWEKFQLDHGRFAGSCDMSLLPLFVFGKPMPFLPQDIGSCVYSNTFRRFVERMLYECCLRGDPEELAGLKEFGPQSIAPFCVTYGFARQRANMKGGDGLYCRPMQESLVKDGVVLCSTPKLRELLANANATSDEDYPEPRSTSLYRKIGDWAWNDALRPYTTCRLLESVNVTSMDLLETNLRQYKPCFVCSMIAIKKIGTHKDGFAIHAQNTGDAWAHNMGINGLRVASDGKIFVKVSNTSWLRDRSNPEAYEYNVPIEEVARWFSRGLVEVASIGEIDGIPSVPLAA